MSARSNFGTPIRSISEMDVMQTGCTSSLTTSIPLDPQLCLLLQQTFHHLGILVEREETSNLANSNTFWNGLEYFVVQSFGFVRRCVRVGKYLGDHFVHTPCLAHTRRKPLFCGESGIRTRGTLLRYTHFPGVLLQPLGHLSVNG